ncbi:hypothetical protein LJB42_000646 [Komagataella kurtzmanii]|nr:hypothetical protein LJB42_000646 [Komagataella kurtzmanii]
MFRHAKKPSWFAYLELPTSHHQRNILTNHVARYNKFISQRIKDFREGKFEGLVLNSNPYNIALNRTLFQNRKGDGSDLTIRTEKYPRIIRNSEKLQFDPFFSPETLSNTTHSMLHISLSPNLEFRNAQSWKSFHNSSIKSKAFPEKKISISFSPRIHVTQAFVAIAPTYESLVPVKALFSHFVNCLKPWAKDVKFNQPLSSPSKVLFHTSLGKFHHARDNILNDSEMIFLSEILSRSTEDLKKIVESDCHAQLDCLTPAEYYLSEGELSQLVFEVNHYKVRYGFSTLRVQL